MCCTLKIGFDICDCFIDPNFLENQEWPGLPLSNSRR
jgi:hypothetical protein